MPYSEGCGASTCTGRPWLSGTERQFESDEEKPRSAIAGRIKQEFRLRLWVVMAFPVVFVICDIL